MINADKNILWLDLFEFLTYKKKEELLNLAKTQDLRAIFLTNSRVKEILDKDEFSKMAVCLQDEYLLLHLKEYEKQNIECITFNDARYPYILKEISTPPFCLYCKGNTQLLNTFCLGVVGARKPTDYGIVVTKQFVKELVAANVTIVSGLASGVDTVAHKTALNEGGNTIAVLAGGFNHIYPSTNIALSKEITENNLIISENNPNVKPLSYYFPVRNRIIAGLSRGVLVTEAGEKSGSLHTFNYAVEYNREVFAIPGKINSEMSKGTNAIIKQLQGTITLSPDDILSTFDLMPTKNEKKSSIQLDIKVQDVLDYIQTEKKTFQQILEKTGYSVQELNSILFELEMAGIVTKLANNSYIMS